MLALALGLALAVSPPPMTLQATQEKLGNGMTVIYSVDHRVPGVAVQVAYQVGSRDESPGRTGFAHLFEHLMFMGSTHAPYPEFDTLMEKYGGQNNAETGNDRTIYYEFGPSNLLQTFLWLEADRLYTLPDTMTDKKVDAQRLVVLNERRQSYENRPYGMTEISVDENLFPPAYPYHWPVIGYQMDLEAASTADVVAFFRKYYTPSNAILCIVGDFDPDKAREAVHKYFAWMPSHPVQRTAPPALPPLAASKTMELSDKVELPKAVLAWRAPPEGTPEDAALDLLGQILAGSKASRLYRTLVYEKQLAQDVSAGENSMKLASIFQVEVLANPGHTAQEEIAAATAVLQELASNGPSQAELDAAKLALYTGLAHALEPLVSRAMLMSRLQEQYGDPTAIGRELARYDQQTVQSIQAAAKKLVAENHFTLTFKPAAAQSEAK